MAALSTMTARSNPRHERDVLDAVKRTYEQNGGWPVAVTDVCKLTWLSRSVVHLHLTNLTAQGRLEKGPRDGWRPRQ